MTRYPATSFAPSRYQMEAGESTDPTRLDELAQRKSNFVQSAVAANEHTAATTLERLANAENKWTRKAVAKNPNTPISTLRVLAGDAEAEVKSNVGYNRNTPTDVLTALAGDLSAKVREGVGWNRNTPASVLTALAGDPDANVRRRVAKNTATPDSALVALARDHTAQVREALAQRNFTKDAPTETVRVRRFNGRTTETHTVTRRVELGNRYPAEVIWEFARGSDVKLHFRAASQPDAPEDVLLYLAARSTVLFTLKVIAENRGASAAVLAAVAERKDTESLKAVVVHPNTDEATLTAIALSPARSVHAEMAHKRPGGLEWLAAHPNPKVRVVAAKQFNAYTGAVDPALAESVGMALMADEDSAVQVAAAESIPSSLMGDFAAHANPKVRKVVAERTMSSDLLATLAADEKPIVRRAVARNVRTPVDALGVLAADKDAKVRVFAAERFLSALGT